MRAKVWTLWLTTSAGLAGALGASACTPDCADAEDIQIALADGTRAGLLKCPTNQTSGGSGGTTLACTPSAKKAPIDDSCGVFVRAAGDDSNEGTKDRPVQTLSKALELARERAVPVYACAETMVEEPTALIVEAGALIFGGLDCAAAEPNAWAYTDEKKTEIAATGVTVRLEKGTGTELHDLRILARTSTQPGKSSVALIANEVTARLVRLEIEARDGAEGEDGAPYSDGATAGSIGTKGVNACSGLQAPGAIAPFNACSSGGDGGSGSTIMGGNGSPGLPNDGPPNFGAGETGAALCTDGTDGTPGTPGSKGPKGEGPGSLDAVQGHMGVSGQNGTPGSPGKGGGGGGGTRSVINNVNQCPGGTSVGASGGSGASGGCGGEGGVGGTAGGSSIGVVSLRSSLTFEASTIAAGKGGAPGLGGIGQSGGVGGTAGGPGGASSGNVKAACKGGRGGNGGAGGDGGNGVGGHSVGIAFTQTTEMPAPSGVTITFGDAGTDGVAAPRLQFQ